MDLDVVTYFAMLDSDLFTYGVTKHPDLFSYFGTMELGQATAFTALHGMVLALVP